MMVVGVPALLAPGMAAIVMYYSGSFSSGSPILEDADENRDGALNLLLRLIGRGFPFNDMSTRILVGRMPGPLPVDVPLPDGARVVGSQLLGPVATIVVDVDSPAQRVLDFYRQRLRADGWTEPDQPMGRHGGFSPGHFGPDLMFCHGLSGPSLSVQANDLEGAPTDLRLNLNLDVRQSPCAPQPRHMSALDLLPTLVPPAGARQSGFGGGGNGSSYHSSATLATDLNQAAVAVHYAQQLRAANWNNQAEGASGPASWSTWTFKDASGRDCYGFFFMLQRPDAAGHYLLHLRADYGVDGDGTFGWSSTTFGTGN